MENIIFIIDYRDGKCFLPRSNALIHSGTYSHFAISQVAAKWATLQRCGFCTPRVCFAPGAILCAALALSLVLVAGQGSS